jgi:hypothetical protein
MEGKGSLPYSKHFSISLYTAPDKSRPGHDTPFPLHTFLIISSDQKFSPKVGSPRHVSQ